MQRKIYLAGRYSRRQELAGYAGQLLELGYVITSRWLDGFGRLDSCGLSEEARFSDRVRFAEQDWYDLMEADICISFTERPRSSNTRGGRHVELGAAIAAGKRVMVVGYRENVFHCLPNIDFFETWRECLQKVSHPPAGSVRCVGEGFVCANQPELSPMRTEAHAD